MSFFVIAIALLLSGCASTALTSKPAIPQYEDPFSKLYPSDPQSRVLSAMTATSNFEEFRRRLEAPSVSAGVPMDRPFTAPEPAAFVPSENAVAFIHYLDLYGLNSQPFINRLVALLKERFPRLVLLDDFAATRRAHTATTILVDVKSGFATDSKDRSWLEASFYFFDQRTVPQVHFLGRAERITAVPMDSDNLQLLGDKVLADLRVKLDGYLVTP